MSYRARLLLLSSIGEIIQEINLVNSTIVLGRSSQSNIVINNHEISRFHAQIVSTPDGFYLSDLTSTNGTFLNEKQLEPRRLYKLHSNDSVRLGKLKLLFQIIPQTIPNLRSRVTYQKQFEAEIDESPSYHTKARGYFKQDQESPSIANAKQGPKMLKGLLPSSISGSTIENPREYPGSYERIVVGDGIEAYPEPELDQLETIFEEKLRQKNQLLKDLREKIHNIKHTESELTGPKSSKNQLRRFPVHANGALETSQASAKLTALESSRIPRIASVNTLENHVEAHINHESIYDEGQTQLNRKRFIEVVSRPFEQREKFSWKELGADLFSGNSQLRSTLGELIQPNSLFTYTMFFVSLTVGLYCYIKFAAIFG